MAVPQGSQHSDGELRAGRGVPDNSGGSTSSVGLGLCSKSWGDDGLGSGSKVALAISSWEPVGNGDPFLATVHSTKMPKFARGPSSDNGALYLMFTLVS